MGNRGWWNQYNSAPDDPATDCHFERFRWRRVLTYHVTSDSCGSVTRVTKYSPGVTLMPERWATGTVWTRSGSSDVTHTEDGVEVCRGVNDWTATVLGTEEIPPGVNAIHIRSEQTTTWTGGRCAGDVTDWQEDYYLLADLPVDGGGTAPAFKRSVGGNLAGGDNWDVWIDRWARL